MNMNLQTKQLINQQPKYRGFFTVQDLDFLISWTWIVGENQTNALRGFFVHGMLYKDAAKANNVRANWLLKNINRIIYIYDGICRIRLKAWREYHKKH